MLKVEKRSVQLVYFYHNYYERMCTFFGVLRNFLSLRIRLDAANVITYPVTIQYLPFMSPNSTLESYDIIKRNVAPPNVETVNYFKVVVCWGGLKTIN